MKKTWLFLLLVLLLAFALRVYRLDAVSLRGDEAFTVNFVQRTWDGLWRGIRFIEPNPPVLYLALRAWIAVAGQTEFAARFFSLWFGVLNIALIYRLAQSLGSIGEKKGNAGNKGTWSLCAAALMAFSPYPIWHSQDVRNYTLLPAVSMTALIFFLRVWRLEGGSWRLEIGKGNSQLLITNYLLYLLSAYTALMTFYFETFTVVAMNIFFAITFSARGGLAQLRARWRALARWGGAQIALLGAYAAWIAQTDRVANYGEASGEQSVGLLAMLTRTATAFLLGDTVPESYQQTLAPFLVGALAFALIALAWRNRAGALFIVLYIAAPLLGVYVTSLGRPLFNDRYLTGILPAYFLLAAFGLAALWEWRTRWRVVPFALASAFWIGMATFALANHYFDAYAKAPNWHGAMQIIADGWKPGDIIVQNFTDDAVTYYRNLYVGTNPALGQPGCENTIRYLPVVTLPKDFFGGPNDIKRLAQLNVECRRIWFIPAAPDWWDPEHVVEKYLTRHDDLILDQTVSTLRTQLYLTPREFEAQMTRVDAQVGSARLGGYRLPGFERDAPLRVAAPATLRVVLYWRTAQKIERDYTVFIHLIDADDNIITQHDRMPVPNDYPTSAWQADEWIVDSHDLEIAAPPGMYTLVAGMYDLATLARLSAFDARGARFPADRVVLTRVTIVH